MAISKVYFTDFNTPQALSIQAKFAKFLKNTDLAKMDLENKFVAIKLHFGEPGNIGYLRPNWARTLVDFLKERGARVFLTDSSTLYPGRRKNALDHLEAAYENGYNPFSVGCHLLIGDGLKGNDEVSVPIDGDHVKEAKVSRTLMDADVIISLNHFKLHHETGIGGAIKNIGMGGGSKAGKMEMHSEGTPEVNEKVCTGCATCIKQCAHDAISIKAKKASVDGEKCVGCGRCISICPVYALSCSWNAASEMLCKKMVEYAWAILKDKPHYHISLARNINAFCDCLPGSGTAIVPDVGIFASADPVAIDVACTEVTNKQPAIAGSKLDQAEPREDFVYSVHPDSEWRAQVEHGAKLGLGSLKYELVEME